MCSRCSCILCLASLSVCRASRWCSGVTLYRRANSSGYLVTRCTGTCGAREREQRQHNYCSRHRRSRRVYNDARRRKIDLRVVTHPPPPVPVPQGPLYAHVQCVCLKLDSTVLAVRTSPDVCVCVCANTESSFRSCKACPMD